MQGMTRLLVSHQRHHLPMCNRIIVLRGGCIVADGTLQELQSQGFEAELGSGQGSGQMAELDDTAYDQGMAQTAAELSKASSTQEAATEGQLELAGTEPIGAVERRRAEADKAEAERNGAVECHKAEASQAEASLPRKERGTEDPQPGDISKNEEFRADSAVSQPPAMTKEPLIGGTEQTADEVTGETGKVQIPSSVFGTKDPASASTKRPDISEAVQKARGPFGTLTSRFSRRTSRPPGAISGVPSMGGQMRTALSR